LTNLSDADTVDNCVVGTTLYQVDKSAGWFILCAVITLLVYMLRSKEE